MGEDTPAGAPARAVTKSDPPEWVWEDKVLTESEYVNQFPLTKWKTLLLRAPLDPTSKALGFYLFCAVVTKSGSTYKSERTMSVESGWSRTSVRKSLAKLEEDGWIVRVGKHHGKTAVVWLAWPLCFRPTGAPGVPVDEDSEGSTGAPDVPALVRDVYLTGAPGDTTGAPHARTGAPRVPDCSSTEQETDWTTDRSLEELRRVRQETGK